MRGIFGIALAAMASASPVITNNVKLNDELAPLVTADNAKAIPDSYMIKFKPHVKADSASIHHSWVQGMHLSSTENRKNELRKRSQEPFVDVYAGLKHTYNIAGSLLGYSGHFDDSVIDAIRRHPDVSEVK